MFKISEKNSCQMREGEGQTQGEGVKLKGVKHSGVKKRGEEKTGEV